MPALPGQQNTWATYPGPLAGWQPRVSAAAVDVLVTVVVVFFAAARGALVTGVVALFEEPLRADAQPARPAHTIITAATARWFASISPHAYAAVMAAVLLGGARGHVAVERGHNDAERLGDLWHRAPGVASRTGVRDLLGAEGAGAAAEPVARPDGSDPKAGAFRGSRRAARPALRRCGR
jgi:hypothetical protein